jgi:hypothetical protein
VLNGVFTIVFVRIALLGAGSALSPFGSPETKSLRVQGLLYLFALTLLLNYFPTVTSRSTGPGFMFTYVFWLAVSLVPWIVSWGESDRRTTTSDGAWKWKKLFSGTPSGAGPYVLAMAVTVTVASFTVAGKQGIAWETVTSHAAHGVGVLFFFSGLTRWFCASKGFAKGKTLSNFFLILSNWIMPLLISISLSAGGYDGLPIDKRLEWMLWPMWPVIADLSFDALWGYGVFGAVTGALLWWLAERRATEVRRGTVAPSEWQYET